MAPRLVGVGVGGLVGGLVGALASAAVSVVHVTSATDEASDSGVMSSNEATTKKLAQILIWRGNGGYQTDEVGAMFRRFIVMLLGLAIRIIRGCLVFGAVPCR